MCECCTPSADSIYKPGIATLIRKKPMTDKDAFFEFKCADGDLPYKPGQFAEISIPGVGEAPFSISSSTTKTGSFEMVIRKLGRVTTALHGLDVGALVGIRGPFGTTFPMDEIRGKDLLFIGGGIGLVPLRSAINYALDHRKDYGKITILFGCSDPSQRLFHDDLVRWQNDKDILFCESVDRCDESWKGNVGVITTLFPKVKVALNPKTTKALIVGPPVMYRFVILELLKMGLAENDIIVSLERRMKCGVGKCGHCQIDNLYVCKDGPVFAYGKIKTLVEAL